MIDFVNDIKHCFMLCLVIKFCNGSGYFIPCVSSVIFLSFNKAINHNMTMLIQTYTGVQDDANNNCSLITILLCILLTCTDLLCLGSILF